MIGSSYGNYLPALLVIAVLMITMNFALSAVATRLERRLTRSRGASGSPDAEAVEADGAPGVLIQPGD